jgi:hypothetical protein
MACAPQYDMSRQKLARSAGVTGDTGQHQVQVPEAGSDHGRGEPEHQGTEPGGRTAPGEPPQQRERADPPGGQAQHEQHFVGAQQRDRVMTRAGSKMDVFHMPLTPPGAFT